MTNEEAIFCEKSYIGETSCIDCKYYLTDTCSSRESHKMAVRALNKLQEIESIMNDASIDYEETYYRIEGVLSIR